VSAATIAISALGLLTCAFFLGRVSGVKLKSFRAG
jgi:hypothetical protein